MLIFINSHASNMKEIKVNQNTINRQKITACENISNIYSRQMIDISQILKETKGSDQCIQKRNGKSRQR